MLRVPLLLACIACGFIAAPQQAALACKADAYDHDGELAAINTALPGVQLIAPERAEADKLLRISSVDGKHLGLRGVALRADARGKLMGLLGLPRIPARPSRHFDVIGETLRPLGKLNESQTEAALLRDEAERLWAKGEYEPARRALAKAVDLLQIHIFEPRC